MRADELVSYWSSLRALVAERGGINIDVSTCDSASSNLRFEQSRRNRFPDLKRLRLACEVHVLSNVQGRVYGIVHFLVQGLLAFALSQQTGGSVAKLRDALARYLSANVIIVRASPPDAADWRTRHRNALLDRLLPDTLAGQKRKLSLQTLINGASEQTPCVP